MDHRWSNRLWALCLGGSRVEKDAIKVRSGYFVTDDFLLSARNSLGSLGGFEIVSIMVSCGTTA